MIILKRCTEKIWSVFWQPFLPRATRYAWCGLVQMNEAPGLLWCTYTVDVQVCVCMIHACGALTSQYNHPRIVTCICTVRAAKSLIVAQNKLGDIGNWGSWISYKILSSETRPLTLGAHRKLSLLPHTPLLWLYTCTAYYGVHGWKVHSVHVHVCTW